MSNKITRWLRSRPRREDPREGERLRTQIAQLEREARRAPVGMRGRALNRAGDLCVRSGERDSGMGFYDRALDAFLEDDQPESARAVAQKILRVQPESVRALGALAWLELGLAHYADAVKQLAEYVDAVERLGEVERARSQVVEMARAVQDPGFRTAAGEALLRLEGPSQADEVFGLVYAGRAAAGADTRARCIAGALRANGSDGGKAG